MPPSYCRPLLLLLLVAAAEPSITEVEPADTSRAAELNLQLVAGTNSLTASWDVVENASTYIISWDPSNTDDSNSADTNNQTSYIIDKLESCVSYNVSVQPLDVDANNVGEADTAMQQTLPPIPDQVSDLRVESLTSTQLYVSWTPPTGVGACELTYTISWEDMATGETGSDTSTTTQYTIRLLTAGTNYSVCVSATAGADYGPPQCVYRVTDNPCQTPYRSVGGRCLFFDPLEKGEWDLVQGFCKGLLGELVKINTTDLLTSIVLFIQDIGVETNYWIGGRDEGQTGEWLWQDGSSVRMGTPFWGYDYVIGCQMPYCADTGYCAAMGPSHFYYFLGLDCAVEASPICEFQGQQ